MYEDFFGLTEKPFSIQPDPSFLYWGRTHRLAYAMLEYGVLNHAGISVVTGEVGCGKTTLIHRLLQQLSDTHTVSLLSNIQEGRGDLLSWVLMGFGQPFAGKSHVELFAQLQTFFIGEYAKGRRIILIIDEAQNLSLDMLEELRLLSNINAGKDQLLQLILVGQPELKGILNRPELVQLAQRVGSDFHLTPLNKEEVHDYIDTRLSIAGCRRRIFTDRAVDLIAEQSRGVPRVINIIADTALVYAFSAEESAVSVETIHSVIRDKTDFGVFGIAANEPSTPPLKPRAHTGPDAFVSGAGGRSASPKKKVENPPEANASIEPPSQARKESPPSPKEAPHAGSRPGAATVSNEEVRPRLRAPEVEMKTASQQSAAQPSERSILPEATAITGIVVVGVNTRISPEAAVYSAGDGRAVIFVPVGAGKEAVLQAKKAGAVVVDTESHALSPGGRARNAGYRQLKKIAPHIQYVQFVDSDSSLDPDWISKAERFMERRPEVAITEGAAPGAMDSHSGVFDTTAAKQRQHDAAGEAALVASSNILVRTESFETVGGFRGDLLVRETEDLSVRIRRRGGRIWRLDDSMLTPTNSTTANTSWWKRGASRGFGNAYIASLHGGPPERVGVQNTARAVIWGFVFPLVIVFGAAAGAIGASLLAPLTPPWLIAAIVAAAGIAVYALKTIASAALRGIFKLSSWGRAASAVFGRFPEFAGVWRFWFSGERPPRAR